MVSSTTQLRHREQPHNQTQSSNQAQSPNAQSLGSNVGAAVAEPLKNLNKKYKSSRCFGRGLVCLLRPKKIFSQFVTEQIRKNWETVRAPQLVNSLIALGCNAVSTLNCISKRKKGAEKLRNMEWTTAKDVADWRVPVPSSKTLVKTLRKVESFDRDYHLSSIGATVAKEIARPINYGYRLLYKENLLELPQISAEMRELLFGTESNHDFSERVENFFISSLTLNPIMPKPNEERMMIVVQQEENRLCTSLLEKFPDIGLSRIKSIVGQDLARLQLNLNNAFKEAWNETLVETRESRITLIRELKEVAEEVVLSSIYKRVAAKCPSKDIVIRELALTALPAVYGMAFSPAFSIGKKFGDYLLPDSITESVNWISQQDYVESVAKTIAGAVESANSSKVTTAAACIAGGVLAKKSVGTPKSIAMGCAMGAAASTLGNVGLDQIGAGLFWKDRDTTIAYELTKLASTPAMTKLLEFGPPAIALTYLILYQELDNLADQGDRQIDKFTSLQGYIDLFQGKESSRDLDEKSKGTPDPNRDYLLPIISTFTLGTISRLCENKGLLMVLQNALSEMMNKSATASAPAPHSESDPDLSKVKAALTALTRTFTETMKEKIKAKVGKVAADEITLQIENAQAVNDEIQQNINSNSLRAVLPPSIAEKAARGVVYSAKSLFSLVSGGS